MNRNIELYIKSQDESQPDLFERIELFDFEDISVTSKIQDVRDISKIFADYSQQFTVPASQNNNKIFKHYYNWDIVDGFDARIKVDGLIKINGINYKEGRISLTGSTLKNNTAQSYSIVFYGKTVSLNDLLGDDKLELLGTVSRYNSLDPYFDSFSFPYTFDTVRNGLNKGFDLVNGVLDINSNPGDGSAGDLCFPLISADSFYFYDTGDGLNPKDRVESRNLYSGGIKDTRGLYFKDLKPAVRLYHIIKAIERKYNIVFTDDFFNTSNKPFYDLYMLLHKEKGNISNQLNVTSKTIKLGEFTKTSGDEMRTSSTSDVLKNFDTAGEAGLTQYRLTYTVTVGASEEYTVYLIDSVTGEYLDTPESGYTQTGPATFIFDFDSDPPYPNYEPKFKLETSGSVTSFDLDLNIYQGIEFEDSFDTYQGYYDEIQSISLSEGFDVAANLPKMKTIDFLTSIFKTFNLTAYYVPEYDLSGDAGKIKVRTLDSYYNEGKIIDLNKYLDTSNIKVNRDKMYSTIDFEFDKPSTFAIVNSNQLTYDEFGNERLNNTNADIESPLAFDGGKYKVKLKFEKIQYERMSNQATEDITDIQWGWLANKDENPVLTKPIIFYPIKQYSTEAILFDNGGSYTTLPSNRYIRPSNALQGNCESVNFGSEFDEWEVHEGTTSIPNRNSLFQDYYSNYILKLYDKQSRRVSVKTKLPVNIIQTIQPNDMILINDKYFSINSMNININKGDTSFELLNNATSVTAGNLKLDVPRLGKLSVTSNSITIRVTGNSSIENLRHDVYVDGTLTVTASSSREITLTSLSGSTEYDITVVSKINGTSIESLESLIYQISTS